MRISKNIQWTAFIYLILFVFISMTNVSYSQDDETVIIVSNSSSMAQQLGRGTKIGFVKQNLNNAIKKFEKRFKAAIIQTTGDNNDNCKPSVISNVSTINQSKMVSLTSKIQTGNNGAITKSLDIASGLFTNNAKNKSIILIADGMDRCGGNPCTWARNYRNQGISTRIHVIGVDVPISEEAGLRCIAGYTRGNYRNVNGSNALLSAIYGVFNAASIADHLTAEAEPNFNQATTKSAPVKTTNFNQPARASDTNNNIITPLRNKIIASNQQSNEVALNPINNNEVAQAKVNYNFNKSKNVVQQVSAAAEENNNIDGHLVTGLLSLPIQRPTNIPLMKPTTTTLPLSRDVPQTNENSVSTEKNKVNDANTNEKSVNKASTKVVEKSANQENIQAVSKMSDRISASTAEETNPPADKKNDTRLASNDNKQPAKPSDKPMSQVQPLLSDANKKDVSKPVQNQQIATLSKGTVDLYAQIIKSSPPLKRGVSWIVRKIGAGTAGEFTSDNGKSLELDSGVYEAEAIFDKASAKTSFTVNSNERSVSTVILNAGGIRFGATLSGKSEISPSLVSVKVARKVDNNSTANYIIDTPTLPSRIQYLNPGIYDIVGSIGDNNDISASITVLPGKLTEAILNFKESVNIVSKAGNVNAKILKNGQEITSEAGVNWQLSNSSGIVHRSNKTDFSLYLRAGKYKLTANLDGNSYVKLFEIANGETKNINITAQ